MDKQIEKKAKRSHLYLKAKLPNLNLKIYPHCTSNQQQWPKEWGAQQPPFNSYCKDKENAMQ